MSRSSPNEAAIRRRRKHGWSRSVGLVVLGLGGLVLTPACGKKVSAPSETREQVLRLSQRNEPGDLDPATVSLPDELFIIRALSEGLLMPAPGGGQRSAAAERWTVSPDGLVYTFYLRPNGRWSNGDAVTAADFVESWRRALTATTASPKVELFFGVKNAQSFFAGTTADFASVGFAVIDTHTLSITLDHPNPSFLAYVASGSWIPVNPRVVAQFGRNWTKPGNFVGNGPFVLTEWRPHQRIVVRKNPLYVDREHVALSEIDFIAFDNGDAEERAYRTGLVDVTMAVPVSKIDGYARERPTEFRRTPLAETRYLAFNSQRPPLNDARVRRALSLTIDRQKIISKVTLSGELASEFVPPALFPSTAKSAQPSDGAYDPAAARDLLVAAGFPGGKGFPRLEMSCWSTSQGPTLEAIQARWKTELGVEISLVTREAKVHLSALRAGDFDIGYATAIPDAADPLVIANYLRTGGGDNYPHWSNAAYDDALNRAERAPTHDAQRPILQQAASILKSEAPVAPLYHNVKNWLIAPRVQRWQEDALWTRYYVGIHLLEKP